MAPWGGRGGEFGLKTEKLKEGGGGKSGQPCRSLVTAKGMPEVRAKKKEGILQNVTAKESNKKIRKERNLERQGQSANEKIGVREKRGGRFLKRKDENN